MDIERVGFGNVIEPPHVTQQLPSPHPDARSFGKPPEKREFARVKAKPAPSYAPVAMEQVERDWSGIETARQSAGAGGKSGHARAEFDEADPAPKRIAQPLVEQPGPLTRVVDSDSHDPPTTLQFAPVGRPARGAPVEHPREAVDRARCSRGVPHRPVGQAEIPPDWNIRAVG